MARRRSFDKDPKMPTLFPAYVRSEVITAIDHGCKHHYRSFVKPHFGFETARQHFVQHADWAVLERAAQVCPGNLADQTYRIPIEVDDWKTNFIIHTPDTAPPNKVPFMWPKEPTVAELPGRDFSPEMEVLYEWVEHCRDTARQWVLVEAMVNAFDDQAGPLSVLKALWPDFDMLLHAIPGRGLDAGVKDWLRRFHEAPTPRSIEIPVPDTMDLLEEVRRTILAMTLMPTELPKPAEGAFECRLRDDMFVEVPWSEWAKDNGKPWKFGHRCW